MAEIKAAAVMALRTKTGLPMMDCKKALAEAEGDEEKAIEILRKRGEKVQGELAGRTTEEGRIVVYSEDGVHAMVELLCETAPVASNPDFVALAEDMAKQLATGPGAETPEELLAQPSPSKEGMTLQQQFDDLINRIREPFKLKRIMRLEGTCGVYVHHNASVGVLLEIEGNDLSLARDICMHIAAMRPMALSAEDIDPAVVEQERKIQTEIARGEGKPENIIEKMIDGRLRNFFAERCLTEQPFVKDDKRTVGKAAEEAGLKLKQMIHWELGK